MKANNIFMAAVISMITITANAQSDSTEYVVYNAETASALVPQNANCVHAEYQINNGYVETITATHHAGWEVGFGGGAMLQHYSTDEGLSENLTRGMFTANVNYVFAWKENMPIVPVLGTDIGFVTTAKMEGLRSNSLDLNIHAGIMTSPCKKLQARAIFNFGYLVHTSQHDANEVNVVMQSPTRYFGGAVRLSYNIGHTKSVKNSHNIKIITKKPIKLFVEAGVRSSKLSRPIRGFQNSTEATVMAGVAFNLY